MARPRRSESGFALLLVFLMAGILAISLYMEIPRVGFQTERNKEQLLMERGEQYKIAIRRFQQVNKRYPANMDELENLNNRRFLRHKYVDPFTGKDEWRLIHINGGVITDSKNQQKKDKPTNLTDSFIAEMPGLGSTPAGAGGVAPALRRRPSEGGTPDPNSLATSGIPGQPGAPGANGFPPQQGQQGIPGQPGTNTATNGLPPGVPGLPPGVPGAPGGIPGQPGMPGAPVNSQTGGVSPAPASNSFIGTGSSFVGGGSSVGSQPNNPAGGNPVYAGQNPATAYPTTPGANGAPPGFPNPGQTAGQGNQAVNMINSILTSPRPGGLAGIQQQQQQGAVGGTGIAGVASTVDQDAIMSYADHTNYSEWEFIYDGRWAPPPDPRQGTGGTPVSQMGNMAGSSPPGTPIGGSAFGSSPGSPAGSPMGSPMGGSQQPTQSAQAGQGGATPGAGGGGGGGGGGGTASTSLNLRPGRQ